MLSVLALFLVLVVAALLVEYVWHLAARYLGRLD